MTEEHINETVTQKNIKEVDFHYKDQQFISIPSRLSEPFIHDFFFILMIEDMHSMMKLSSSVQNKTYEFNIAWLFPTNTSQKNTFRLTSFLSRVTQVFSFCLSIVYILLPSKFLYKNHLNEYC